MAEDFNVPTGLAAGALPLTSYEKETLTHILDGFFSCTAKDAAAYQEELKPEGDVSQHRCAFRFQDDYIIGVRKEKLAFNYHDEDWTEYEILYAEKIPEKVFAGRITGADLPEFSSYFERFRTVAEHCHVVSMAERYKLGRICEEKAWWNIYMTGFISKLKDLPGFFRFIYATGSDRNAF